MSAWSRRSGESKEAFAAFQHYLNEGTIDAAYRASNPQAKSNHANGTWTGWSARYEWVSRAAAYQSHLADQNRELWERRKAQARERDWTQADRMRDIVDDSQIMADQFLRSKTTTVQGTPTVVNENGDIIQYGTPTRQLITTALDIVAISKVLSDAINIQLRATGQPTERIELTGAALHAFIERQLARLVDGSQTDPGDAPGDYAAETDEGTEPDAYDL